jgi:bifunctional DNA-binding transcriptional regulator/antitoxin component of YhaV-PrlF toxin-antitoxin module
MPKSASIKAVLQVDKHGSITLPTQLRRAICIKIGDELIAETTSQGLLLRPARTPSPESYSDERIQEFKGEETILKEFLSRPRPGN